MQQQQNQPPQPASLQVEQRKLQPTPPPVAKEGPNPADPIPPTSFKQRKDLVYLEKLTCRVLGVIQTHGKADLQTITNAVKADPVAVSEVLDVLYATPLISLSCARKDEQEEAGSEKSSSSNSINTDRPLQYTYTNNLYELPNINPATFQHDYNTVLNHVAATDQRIEALRNAIEAKKRENEAVELMQHIE
jgi:hypothetical protein